VYISTWLQAGKLKFMHKFSLSLIVTSAAPARRLIRSVTFLAAMAAVPLAAGVSSAQQTASPQFPMPDASSPSPRSGLNGRADDPMTQQANEKRVKELNVLRQKQMTSDAAKLLLLATELKTNLDKGAAEASSLEMLHKAELIEKLARSVRTRMTDAAGNERGVF
jgi:hypothetical protein